MEEEPASALHIVPNVSRQSSLAEQIGLLQGDW
jgi:hypothetical protein